MIREKFGLNEEDGKLMAKVARRSHQISSHGIFMDHDSSDK